MIIFAKIDCFTERNLVFFAYRRIINNPGIDNILIEEPGFLVVRQTNKVNSVSGELYLNIVIAGVFKLDLTVYELILCPALSDFRVCGYLYFDEVVITVSIIADTLVKFLVRSVNKILVHQQVSANGEHLQAN